MSAEALRRIGLIKYRFFFLPNSGGTMPLFRLAAFSGYPHEPLEEIPLPYGNSARESLRLGQCATIQLVAPNVLNVQCFREGGNIGEHEFVHQKWCSYLKLNENVPEIQQQRPQPSMDMEFVLPQTKESIEEQLEMIEQRKVTLLEEIEDHYFKLMKQVYKKDREYYYERNIIPPFEEILLKETLEEKSYVPLVAEDIRQLVLGEKDSWL